MFAGDSYRQAIGLAVGPTDLDLFPLSVRWDYASPERRDTPRPHREWPICRGSASLHAILFHAAHAKILRQRLA